MWNHEFNWRTGAFDQAASCAAGSCFPHLGYNQTDCQSTPWCTVECDGGRPCANQTECEAAAMCDDTELYNPYYVYASNGSLVPVYAFPHLRRIVPMTDRTRVHGVIRDGVCVYPFQLEEQTFDLRVSCPLWTKKARIGCIDYLVETEADCLALTPSYGAMRWLRPSATKAECLAYGAFGRL